MGALFMLFLCTAIGALSWGSLLAEENRELRALEYELRLLIDDLVAEREQELVCEHPSLLMESKLSDDGALQITHLVCAVCNDVRETVVNERYHS